jgi:hypothetical protein
MFVNQLVLVLAACALGGASLRIAAAIADGVAERIVAAAPLAAGFALLWTLALGLAGLGGSVVALAAGPVAAWLAARWLAPAPALSIAHAAAAWWRRAPRRRRVVALALLGAAAGCVVEVAIEPAFDVDAVSYHLADVFGWLHSGRAGSVQTFSYDFPVGYYPVTNEVLLTWVLGISRSFVPLAAWPTALLALTLLALWRLLALLAVPSRVRALAVAALATLPVLVIALNTDAPGTDLPALAWLACTAALSAAAAHRPALLGPALLAAGLGVGTKTTVAPLAVVALVAGVWRARDRLRPALGWLSLGAVGGLLAGVPWYVRNTLTHGWPLWPFNSGPSGDPMPHLMRLYDASFLSRPRATVSATPNLYLKWVAGGIALMLGALLAPALARSRAVLLSAVVAVASVLAWAAAPFTGVASSPLLAPLALTTVRYLLPAIGACIVALSLLARDGAVVGRWFAIGVLGVGALGSIVADLVLGYPNLPRWPYLLGGALLGAALAAIPWGELPRMGVAPLGAGPRMGLAPLGAAGALLAAVAFSLLAPGWLHREAKYHRGPGTAVLSFALARPGFASGREPIAFAPVMVATLAGPRLSHPLSLLPARASCDRVRARLRRGWVVLQPRLFIPGVSAAFDAPRCLSGVTPVYNDGTTVVYAPENPR